VIKIVVPVPAGPTLDVLPRIIADKLSTRWGKPVIVENRSGAAQMLGAEAVAKAAPDGYTLLASPPGPLVVAKSFYKTLRFDPTTFVPISVFATQPLLLVARPSLPVTSFPDFIAYAKAQPHKLSYGSAGIGSVLHLTGEMLKIEAGIDMVHVPYPGLAPVLVDLMAGRIDVAFVSGGNVLANARQGKLIILAVAGTARIPALPTIPAIAETIPGIESASWFAMVAPPKTKPETAAFLSEAIDETLHQSDVLAKFRALSIDPVGTSPAETAALLKRESARWRGVIEKARIARQ
jgi:tripartite-type tricarboxylate transporter receptor subunit TctC